MDTTFKSKELIPGLVDVLSAAINHGRLEDAELMLGCVRALKPNVIELDTYEAWIAMKRGFWTDAIRLLRNIDNQADNFMIGKALLAFSLFASGDATWRASANEVIDAGTNAEAIELVSLLIDPEGAVSGKAQIGLVVGGSEALPPPVATADLPQGAFLRA
jgi:type III secretion protein HrpB1